MRLVVSVCLLIAFSSVHALTLKIATISPDGTTWMKEMRRGADEIKQRTNGRVKFRFYPGGVMGSDKHVLRKIRIGQLHGGALTGGGLEEIYGDSQIYSLPFAFRSQAEVDYVRERMDESLIRGLYQRGFVSFGMAEGGFAYLMANQPIHNRDELKEHKVWVPEGDRISRLVFEEADISPVPLPLPDVLTGLQTGLIDTVGTSPIGAIALQWHTRVKYVTDAPLMYLYGILIVSRKAFDRIAAEDQLIVKSVMRDVFKRLNRLNREENRQARQALLAQGIKFVTPSENNQQQWEGVMQTAMQRMNGSSIISPEVMETLQRYLNDYRRMH